ncbi:G-type lectin S-receptor-like serine/threonine-protein kinase LECRK4 [Amborella trichopoda]|nr:G-type lectin S-receptor-like serine/threonine-protein kinase LECRK4 [Amborella trichopoda]|eukprot:XP_020526420.1 G-type lectin S-receptor-like serine/threonine-protein kinase LECRK4 [Amborella trichopoda]
MKRAERIVSRRERRGKRTPRDLLEMRKGASLYKRRARNQFLIGIWFHKIPEKTLVWAANRDKPVEIGSKIRFTNDGELLFIDSHGHLYWIYNGTTGATSASMLDTGNFVLVDPLSRILWQSFDYPTDTLLPGQTLGQEKPLYSNRLERDYSTGRFMLVLQYDGNLVLYPRIRRGIFPNPAYFASQTNGEMPPVNLVFDRTRFLYLQNFSNKIVYSVSSNVINPIQEYYQRAMIDSDGFFRRYSLWKNAKNGEAWSIVSHTPSNRNSCGVPGICGLNGYCILDQGGRAQCLCPDKFSFVDTNYTFGGCKRDFVISCENYKASNYLLIELENVNWPYGNYELLHLDEDECKEACLSDCFCDAAIYTNNQCWKKRMPLMDGVKDVTMGGKALIKVSRSG